MPRWVASVNRARLASTLTCLGALGVLGAGGVADDRGEVHERPGTLERRGAGGLVADVALDEPRAGAPEAVGDLALTVQQHVERGHLVPAGQQPPDQQRADIPGAAGDHDPHDAGSSLGSMSSILP